MFEETLLVSEGGPLRPVPLIKVPQKFCNRLVDLAARHSHKLATLLQCIATLGRAHILKWTRWK